MVSALQNQCPLSVWYLNLEKVNSYATERSTSSSEEGSHNSSFQSLQSCPRARSLDSGPYCPPLHKEQRSLVRKPQISLQSIHFRPQPHLGQHSAWTTAVAPSFPGLLSSLLSLHMQTDLTLELPEEQGALLSSLFKTSNGFSCHF